MEDFKKFSLLKEQPTTASGGTEQDAAHSFEKKENDVLDKFIDVVENRHFLEEFAPGGYWKVKEGMQEECNAISEVKEFVSDCVTELTRLRSELQQQKYVFSNVRRDFNDMNKNLMDDLTCAKVESQQKDEVIKELLVIADDIIGGMECFPNRHRKEDEYALRSLIARAKELLKSKAK